MSSSDNKPVVPDPKTPIYRAPTKDGFNRQPPAPTKPSNPQPKR